MPRAPGSDKSPAEVRAEKWAKAIKLLKQGATRHAAAKAAGLYPQFVRDRLRRMGDRHGYPPFPDGRRKPKPQPAA